ncbi:hypothetical protein H1230_03705 [Paenibacillus sp. 19GGS1-52]|uniref:hypothetical protein n=1 Tax=Paenibacillus sp. 19GGS1-52 TaxID=2758563 RepID=UPI001EFBC8CA|nr:hypothetical protein [Paenibacillus sp. 19GGS1-52]ULO07975.1 hypothetical protein H1230_03705 [Paenibacillus sp. 19GGS1-52]
MSIHRFKRRFKQEQGSALVLVMFIVLLLTILGISVLSAAVGGAQRTETRKNDVQSLHLAEKTLDEAVAYITSSLNKKVSSSVDLSQDELDQAIKLFLNTLTTDLTASTDLNHASGRIVDVKTSTIGSLDSGQSVSYELTIKSEAEVNGVTRNLTQKVIIDTFPDFLKYTLGSEKNLTINGSPFITGNIYAGDTLTVNDKVPYRFKGNHTMISKSFELKGEAHVQSLDKLIYLENGLDELKASEITDTTPMTGKIDQSKVKIRSHRKFVEVNVEESFIDKVAEALGTTSANAGTYRSAIRSEIAKGTLAEYLRTSGLFDYMNPPIKPVLAGDTPEQLATYNQQLIDYQAQVTRLTAPQKSVVVKGNLALDGTDLPGIIYSESVKNSTSLPRKWFVVDGDLIIDNYGQANPIQVRANILVTGKVEIRGNVQFDSTLFVLKKPATINGERENTTLVEDAEITGLNGKELVLMSQGPILINRLAAFSNDKPAPLDAFFYTDSDAELYGVGSIFSLSGGFFAKGNLTINAVRGTATAGVDDIVIVGSNLIRFQAAYNDQIFKDQNAGLPRVNTVNIHIEEMQLE